MRKFFRPSKTRQSQLRRRRAMTPSAAELLEPRQLLTSMIYLDFGDSFPAGGLQTDAAELYSAVNGPDLSADVAGEISMNSLASIVDALHSDGDENTVYDFNGDGTESTADADFLKRNIVNNVRRAYEPFDVEVRVAPAQNTDDSTTYLNNVKDLLDQGPGVDGDRDAYVFVTSVEDAMETSVGDILGLKGTASGRDLAGVGEEVTSNATDESAVVFADRILSQLEGADASAAEFELAAVAAREAANTFGVRDAWSGQMLKVLEIVPSEGTANFILIEGDYTDRLTGALNLFAGGSNVQIVSIREARFISDPEGDLPQHTRVNIRESFEDPALAADYVSLTETSVDQQLVAGDPMADDLLPIGIAETPPLFSRYDLLAAWPASTTVGNDVVAVTEYQPFEILAQDGNLGLKSAEPAYYTGTGANDVITLTRVNADTATLTIRPYADINHSIPLADATVMDIDVSNGVHIDSGGGDDIFNIDAKITASIAVSGAGQSNSLVLDGAGNYNATLMPDDDIGYSGISVDQGIRLSYRELEDLTVFDFAKATVNGSDSIDDLETSGDTAATIIGGTIDGDAITPIAFQSINEIVVELDRGADTFTINNGSLDTAELQEFTVRGGYGFDVFEVAPSVTVPITIEGESPDASTGDILDVDLAATTGIDVPQDQTSGRIRTSSHSPVDFTSIEEVTTNVTFVQTPDGEVNTARPEVKWTAVRGATSYQVFISNIHQQKQVVNEFVGNVTEWTPPEDLDQGAHRVWVRPWFGSTPSTWSKPLYFSVSVTPTTLLPAANILDSTPTLEWESPGDVKAFDVWVSNRTAGTSRTYRVDGTERSFTVPEELGIGVYRFSVRAINQQNVPTGWSRFKQFNIVTRPTLIRPGLATLQDPVTLEWDASLGATRYDVWVNEVDSRGQQTRYKVVRGLTSLTYTLNDLPAGNYRWWVLAYNDGASGSANVRSFWSAPKDFSVGDIKPVLTMPRGSVIQSTITWEDIDFIGRWEVYIASANGGMNPIIDDQVRTNSYEHNLPAGEYFVWVRAISRRGQFTKWSDPVLFSTRPSITAPAERTSDLLPRFEWTPVRDAVRYELWVEQDDVEDPVILVEVTDNYYQANTVPLATTGHRAWVRGIAADGTKGHWSQAYRFEIQS